MAHGERDVGVAGLPNGLAVVQGLEDGEEAGVLLYVPRNRVQMPRPLVGRRLAPRRQRAFGRVHRQVHVFRLGLHVVGEVLAGGGGEGGFEATPGGLLEAPVDEHAELAVVDGEPRARRLVRLRGKGGREGGWEGGWASGEK